MEKKILAAAHLSACRKALRDGERAPATVEKYLRDVRAFLSWLDGRAVTIDPQSFKNSFSQNQGFKITILMRK